MILEAMLHSFMVNLTQTKVIQEEGTSTKEMFKRWAVVAHTLNSSTQEKLFSICECFACLYACALCVLVHAEIRGRHE